MNCALECLLASCAKSSSSSSSSSIWLFVTVATGVGGLILGAGLFASLDLLEELASLCIGLTPVASTGKGEPKAIASCFASKLCRQSFSSRPRAKSSSSPVVVSICISFFWLERHRLTRSTITSSFTAAL